MIYRGQFTGLFERVDFERELCKGCKHNGFCDRQLWASPSCSKIDDIKEYMMEALRR